MHIEFISAIEDCAASDWDRIAPQGYPFTRHAFLTALEHSGSVGGRSGWQAHHALVRDGGELAAVMPLYLKQHSYGEYVFDWSWANAYHRHGLDYYPKLVAAIPFTPATGPRLLLAEGASPRVITELARALDDALARHQASGWHVLFPGDEEGQQWLAAGALERRAVQYHWFNQGYRDFDDFLAGFNSRKRKNLRKERQRVADQGIELVRLAGNEIEPEHWQAFFTFYQLTYAKRSGHGGYLSEDFFHRIGATMAQDVMLVLARQDDEWIAGALNFIGADTLYGRYWGCARERDFLHFEACYYQGIEFCLQRGLQRFDPGAQGEHKIQRGFTPVLTRSYHRLAHPAFRRAIAEFLEQEQQHTEAWLREAAGLLPFKHPAD